MKSRHKGQAVVEMALILPILVLLVMGCVDLGRVFYYQETITNVTREGARYGALHPSASTSSIQSDALGEANNMSGITVSVTITSSDVTVVANYTFQPITPVIQSIVGTSIVLKSSSTMAKVSQ